MLDVQDIMRETCMTDLAGIWYNLVATYSKSNPELAEAVLTTVKRYVSWIDIGLVANDRFEITKPLYLARSSCNGVISGAV